MPEYPAAVGLAELDHWSDKQRRFLDVSQAYGETFKAYGIRQGLWRAPDISSSYVLLDCGDSATCDSLIAALLVDQVSGFSEPMPLIL